MKQVCWDKSIGIERILRDENVEFRRADAVSLADIMITKEAVEQIRIDGVNPTTVNNYADAMKRGDIFPPGVYWQRPDKKLEPLDGIHTTLGAREAGLKTIHGYIVETDSERAIDILRRSLNTLNSLNDFTVKHRIQHAVTLVRQGMSVIDAAKKMCASKGSISLAIRVDDVRIKIVDNNPKITGLNQTTLEDLSKISNDVILLETAALIHERALRGAAIKVLVNAVRGARGESAAKEILEKERTRHRSMGNVRGVPVVRRSVADNFNVTIQVLINAWRTNKAKILASVVGVGEVADAKERALAGIASLNDYLRELELKQKRRAGGHVKLSRRTNGARHISSHA